MSWKGITSQNIKCMVSTEKLIHITDLDSIACTDKIKQMKTTLWWWKTDIGFQSKRMKNNDS